MFKNLLVVGCAKSVKFSELSRRNKGAEGQVGNCCSLKGLVDHLTLSQLGMGTDYAHQIIIKNLLVVGCAKSVKVSGP